VPAGVDPNAVYTHELTALMWAAGYGHDDTVRALLAAGARADTIEVVDVEDVPLAYLPGNATRVHVKVVGDLHVA